MQFPTTPSVPKQIDNPRYSHHPYSVLRSLKLNCVCPCLATNPGLPTSNSAIKRDSSSSTIWFMGFCVLLSLTNLLCWDRWDTQLSICLASIPKPTKSPSMRELLCVDCTCIMRSSGESVRPKMRMGRTTVASHYTRHFRPLSPKEFLTVSLWLSTAPIDDPESSLSERFLESSSAT